MRLNRKLACLVCMAIAQFATVAHAETWHTAKIRNVYPLGDGSMVLVFAVDAAACTSGVSGKYHYIRAGHFGVNAEGVRLISATALMAFAADRTVSVAFDETSGYCDINRLMALGQ